MIIHNILSVDNRRSGSPELSFVLKEDQHSSNLHRFHRSADIKELPRAFLQASTYIRNP